MTAPQPPHPEPAHAPAAAARWFDQWHVYRAIVDANWMAHEEIFAAVRRAVLVRHPGPFTLLDLGCGDAGFVRRTFDDTGLWAYTGVDASPTALAKARDELAGARFAVRLVEAEMLASLRTIADPAAAPVDLILASYAVHHLPAPEKREFFRLAHGRLAPRGSLLFADVFRRDGEPRGAYLEAYADTMRRTWLGMSPESLASVIAHVTERDYPETSAGLFDMARAAGWSGQPQELFRDATGFHRLLAFAKGAGA